MDNEEALAIVTAYKEQHGHPGTLEAMIAMRDDPDLTPKQKAGYHVAFLGFYRLFEGEPE